MTFLHSMRICARRAGLEVQRADYQSIEAIRLVKQLRFRECGTVLDIGANSGQFAAALFDEGHFDGEVVSFEPIPEAYAVLKANAKTYTRKGKNWRVAPQCAIGAAEGTAQFHVSENSVSSSLAHIADAHIKAAPLTRVSRSIPVQVRTLQSLVSELDITSEQIFVKMDTQGTEDQVLTGAASIMDRVAGIKVELSAVELYLGQKLYPEMDAIIRGLGFQLWDIVAGSRNHSSLQMLQYDGIYFREAGDEGTK